ncbi:MAG: hydantoinase/oxoprolinase family protein [Schwartzia succinivorans]|uniref:hydantoinase/oxoprolinase family protein n=1 Tax=Schwartzia succinivorans TaxID=55507 RepID=UPI00235657FF|nr:hydantoinase/oxoprolinase family protein [Schwartzia succinivorans]MBE6097270.1 hydantoinase/oxoprolinase family protein [Schwartzia succinivorans]
MRRVRIGIDVGGTFTDAVAIDDATQEIIAKAKRPTTHDAKEGVAEGIIEILRYILTENNIAPEEVVFIAHGTTQATNALLEGDVAKVGVIGMGSGFFAGRAASDTDVGDITLAPGKYLRTAHAFIETDEAEPMRAEISRRIDELAEKGAAVIVASEAFGVDHPESERLVMELAGEKGLPSTGGHEVSHLYGLKVRTRTAVINGSLIPRMMETADMTEECVKRINIGAPLMIMRCDGGVMTADEVRRRPILTMLSGLAAGVAGALMYEKLSNGIFLEAGGTSTDISAVRDGRVMVRSGELGGHKMYLRSLDVRTLGVAGGSMIRVENGKITDAGPRSAHIAGLPYEVFSPKLKNPRLVLISPCGDDEPVFAAAEGADGRRVSLTLAGAANLLGSVPDGDYASGDREAALAAWWVLGDALGISAEEAAKQAMDIAASKVRAIVDALVQDYEIPKDAVMLAGGGGSAGVIVPYLGKVMGVPWREVKNAPIISTIGVAMAMVTESVERTVVQPKGEDVKSIRREAIERVMKSGAKEETVEVSVEVDQKANILRAVATGAAELRQGKENGTLPSRAELLETAAKSIGVPSEQVQEIAALGRWHIFDGIRSTKTFGFENYHHAVRVIDRDGVVRLQREGIGAVLSTKGKLQESLDILLEETTEYGTVGGQLPSLFAYYGEKQLDLSGLATREQVDEVLDMEMDGREKDEPVAVLAVL